ncbi:hypothetical protein FHT40_004035 [Mycolicibacterium sp. BK556]|uniref:hypothetical protein n=1 Tax=unclassified Mycolicibacterium TaxID=2636767 RepID=UPI0016140C64|nr:MULTISPECIES: hypothetical protein [unclassified Mycolicibacterium]MBB3604357.1 hypothetical protein [Mycolicibacterium sp. BK556]MBB3634930.1 hypothetical protein [Mycolicibacterium sp. BK607]MBB3752794.1 hypothetical protein [Mycolicibacterium sp. BK634]
MCTGLRRTVRVLLGILAAIAVLIAPAVVTSAERSGSVAQGCYDGVIPWNPYLQSCSLPRTQPRVRGAAPDAGAIIACRHHPGCLAWYINGGP